ncbi:MAG TPA: NADH-quinone oxidoreductase subunit N [Gemmataceae bacterium]|nr:NADH-quinone oxidoreductase subunit N [Gemmataceae bacterium]
MFPNRTFISDTTEALQRDVGAFLPELVLCGTIVLLLLSRFHPATRRIHAAVLALLGTVAALVVAVGFWPGTGGWDNLVPASGRLTGFSGLLAFDLFGLYVRVFLLAFLVLALWLSLLTGIPDVEDSADYVTLLVGGTLGMMLMASANHLLMAFIAIEMASLPSYALSGFLKGRRQGSEAALKYVIYGASASGVMLYGISLIAGTVGTGGFDAIAQSGTLQMPLPVVVGAACVLVGLGFKLAAVPFHFWCPDVFTGAAAEVGAFLSVASKAAALALTTRFLFVLAPLGDAKTELVAGTVSLMWGAAAAVTTTFGNLAALRQTNLKRLLAYSTIAHAGMMMFALAPVGPKAVGPLLFYMSAYLLMNLGAFAVVALVRNATGSEDIEAYRGLARRSPILAVGMAVFLLSLLGLPPLAGFAAKFQVFAGLYETGRQYRGDDTAFAWLYFGLLAIAALNTAISAGYYLKVVRAMTLDDAADAPPIRVSVGGRLLIALLVGLVFAVGVFWGPLAEVADRAAAAFGTGGGR